MSSQLLVVFLVEALVLVLVGDLQVNKLKAMQGPTCFDWTSLNFLFKIF